MFYLTLILTVLLLPLSLFVGRKKTADGHSPLRGRFSVWHGIAALAVFLAYYEIAYASIQADVPYGVYNDVSTEYLRYLELALVGFYWLVILATEGFGRRRDRIRLGLTWTLGVILLTVAIGAALAIVYATQAYYFAYTAGGGIGMGLAGLLYWTNRLLTFQEGWQRRAVTAVNAVVCLATVATVVWAVMQGAAALEGMTPDPGTLVLVGLVLLAIAAPSVVCLGSVVAAHLKAAGVGE